MTDKKENKKQKSKEIKMSPEKWARKEGIDTDLVLWWTNNGKLYTKKEFEEIKNKVI
jgi:hypothetical protein